MYFYLFILIFTKIPTLFSYIKLLASITGLQLWVGSGILMSIHILLVGFLIAFQTCYCLITPPQVLLPYISDESDSLILAQLRSASSGCVYWSTTSPEAISFIPTSCVPISTLSDINQIHQCALKLNSKCHDSVWVTAVKTLKPPYRVWVYTSETQNNSYQNRSYAEVLIKELVSVDFETRNRRIAVGQLATLRLIGYDDDKNTFTSLQGIPFEITNSDPSVMKISGSIQDPEEATFARMSLIASGLLSDLLTVQGLKVGESNILLRVNMPQYRNIELNVKFTVSEPFAIEPNNIVVAPGSAVKLCLLRVSSYGLQSSGSDSLELIDLPKNYYQWSCNNQDECNISNKGILTISKTHPLSSLLVKVTDGRSGDESNSLVTVSDPVRIFHAIDSLESLFEDWPNLTEVTNVILKTAEGNAEKWDKSYFKNVNALYWNQTNSTHTSFFNELYQKLKSQCSPFLPTSSQGWISHDGVYHLSLGHTYVIRFTLHDDLNRQIHYPDNLKLTLDMDVEKTAKILWSNPLSYLLIIHTVELGTGSFSVSLDGIGDFKPSKPISYTLKYKVNERIAIDGFLPTESFDTSKVVDKQHHVLRHYTADPLDPVYLYIGEDATTKDRCYSKTLTGGSGSYHTFIHGSPLNLSIDGNTLRICPNNEGESVITILDRFDHSNIYLLPVVSTLRFAIKVMPDSLNIPENKVAKFKLLPVIPDYDSAKGKYKVLRNFNMDSVTLKLPIGASMEVDKYNYYVNGLKLGRHKLQIHVNNKITSFLSVNVYETLRFKFEPDFFNPLTSPPLGLPFNESVKKASGGFFSFLYGTEVETNRPSILESSQDFIVGDSVALLVGSTVKVKVFGGSDRNSLSVDTSREFFSIKVDNNKSTFDLTCLRESQLESITVTKYDISNFEPDIVGKLDIICSYPAYSRVVPYRSMDNLPEINANNSISAIEAIPFKIGCVTYNDKGFPLLPTKELSTFWFLQTDSNLFLENLGQNFFIQLDDVGTFKKKSFDIFAVQGWRMTNPDAVPRKSPYPHLLTSISKQLYRYSLSSMDAVLETPPITVRVITIPFIIPENNLLLPIGHNPFLVALGIPTSDGKPVIDSQLVADILSTLATEHKDLKPISLLTDEYHGIKHEFAAYSEVERDFRASFHAPGLINSSSIEFQISFGHIVHLDASVWKCSDKNSFDNCTSLITNSLSSTVNIQIGTLYVFVLSAFDKLNRRFYPNSLLDYEFEISDTGGHHFDRLKDINNFDNPAYSVLFTTLGEFKITFSVNVGNSKISSFLIVKTFKPLRTASEDIVLLPGTSDFDLDFLDGPPGIPIRSLNLHYVSSDEKIVSIGENGLLNALNVGDAVINCKIKSKDETSLLGGDVSISVTIHVSKPDSAHISMPLLANGISHTKGQGKVRVGYSIPLAINLVTSTGLVFSPHYLSHSIFLNNLCKLKWEVDNELLTSITLHEQSTLATLSGIDSGNVKVKAHITCGKTFTPSYNLQVYPSSNIAYEVYAQGLHYSFNEATIAGAKFDYYSAKPANNKIASNVGHIVRTDGDKLLSVAGVQVIEDCYMLTSVHNNNLRVELVSEDGYPVENPSSLHYSVTSTTFLNLETYDQTPLFVFMKRQNGLVFSVISSSQTQTPKHINLLVGGAARFNFENDKFTFYYSKVPESVTREMVEHELTSIYHPVNILEFTNTTAGQLKIKFSFVNEEDRVEELVERIAKLLHTQWSDIRIATIAIEELLQVDRIPVVDKALRLALSLLPAQSHYSLPQLLDWQKGIVRSSTRVDEADGFVTFDKSGEFNFLHHNENIGVTVTGDIQVETCFYNGLDFNSLSDQPSKGDYTYVFKPLINSSLYYSNDFIQTNLYSTCQIDDTFDIFFFESTFVPLLLNGNVIALPACKFRLANLTELKNVKLTPSNMAAKLVGPSGVLYEKNLNIQDALNSMLAFYDEHGNPITRLDVTSQKSVLCYPIDKYKNIVLNNVISDCASMAIDRSGLVANISIKVHDAVKCRGHVAMLEVSGLGEKVHIHSTNLIGSPLSELPGAGPNAGGSGGLTLILIVVSMYFFANYLRRGRFWRRSDRGNNQSPWIQHQRCPTNTIHIQRENVPLFVRDLQNRR